MQLLYRAAKFTSHKKGIEDYYKDLDLERVQKSAVRVILGPRYSNYKQGLKMVNGKIRK